MTKSISQKLSEKERERMKPSKKEKRLIRWGRRNGYLKTKPND